MFLYLSPCLSFCLNISKSNFDNRYYYYCIIYLQILLLLWIILNIICPFSILLPRMISKEILCEFSRCRGYLRSLSLVFPLTFYKQAASSFFARIDETGPTNALCRSLCFHAITTCQLYFRERERHFLFWRFHEIKSFCVTYAFSPKYSYVPSLLMFINFSREK